MLTKPKLGWLIQAIVVMCATSFAASSDAACTAERVKRLSKLGHTVTTIARTCSMEKQEVQDILDEEEPEPETTTGRERGAPAGIPIGQCGCWGPASPQQRQAHPACQSGYARPSSCNFQCVGGGVAWQGVCT